VTDPNLKYGVSNNFDIELEFAPLVLVRTHNSLTGDTRTLSGVGDLFLRGKWAAIGNGGSDFALVLEPYLKLPTARLGIGDGAVEGGLVVPISLALGSGWSLATTPELDLLKNATGDRRHVNLIDVISLGGSVTSNLTLGTEIWEATNFDTSGTSQSWSMDLVVAWQPDSETQLDAGVNVGLNRNTPGAQIYTGVSRRF
jgi:hypothetical protein